MTLPIVAAEAVLVAIAAAGIWFDVRYRRLPNWLCLAALVAGLGFGAALGGWSGVPWALLHALIALAVGIGLFALGAVGAGDAKFYASLAVWFRLEQAPLMLGLVSLAGLGLLIVWLPWQRRRRLRAAAPPDGNDLFDKLPYGVAIAIGAAAAFMLGG
jgi:prepilin peptidase CpaA